MYEPAAGMTCLPVEDDAASLAHAGTLEWTRNGVAAEEWRLLCDGRRWATMSCRGAMPHLIEVTSLRGRWRSERAWTRLALLREGPDELALRYQPGLIGGRIFARPGPDLFWERTSRRGDSWRIASDERSALLHVHGAPLGSRAGGRIELEDRGRQAPDIDALVVLGWMLAVRRRARGQ